MAKQVQLRRGTTAELSSVTGAEGEVIVDTTKDTLTLHDNYTAGGIPMLREDVGNLADQSIDPSKVIKGSANQVLITNAAGTDVEWGYANNASSLSAGTLSTDRMAAGTVVGIQRLTYTSRVGWSDAANYVYWSGNINKQYSNSIMLVDMRLSMRDNYSDVLMHQMYIGNGGWNLSTMGYDAGFSANSRPAIMRWWIADCTGTGSQGFQIRWTTNNNSGGNKPAHVWNPNSGDDARHPGEFSELVIWEIMQ